MVLYKNKVYSSKSQPIDLFFYIPADQLESSRSDILLGYVLKKDTVEDCFTFYAQPFHLPERYQ